MGEWKRQDQILKLDWWHPTKGVFPDTTKFDWYWIRVLGLPLHLWNSETMRKIGDKCGGWLENEEETELKNHLRWARIRVKGPREKIPPSIEVEDENLVFSMPVWCEEPATYRKKILEKMTVETSSQGERSNPSISRATEIFTKKEERIQRDTFQISMYTKKGCPLLTQGMCPQLGPFQERD